MPSVRLCGTPPVAQRVRGKVQQPGECDARKQLDGERPGNAVFVPPRPSVWQRCGDMEQFIHQAQPMRAGQDCVVHAQFEHPRFLTAMPHCRL